MKIYINLSFLLDLALDYGSLEAKAYTSPLSELALNIFRHLADVIRCTV